VKRLARTSTPARGARWSTLSCRGCASWAISTVRSAGSFVEKILKGTKPGEIAFGQSTKLELVVNQKAAHELGMRIPASVLVSADVVID